MADTATTRCDVALRHVLMRSAIARIFSPVATELPPYFCTTIEPRATLEPAFQFSVSRFGCRGALRLRDRSPACLFHEIVELLEGAAQLHRRFHPRVHHFCRLVPVAGDADDDRLVS